MITIERTFDAEIIKAIVTIPYIYRRAIDDGRLPPEQYQPWISPLVYHLLAKDESNVLGLFTAYTYNAVCLDVHVHMLPAGFGAKGIEAGKAALKWAFQYTGAELIFGSTPEDNTLAIRFLTKCGAKRLGYLPRGCRFNGRLQGMIVSGITKEEN